MPSSSWISRGRSYRGVGLGQEPRQDLARERPVVGLAVQLEDRRERKPGILLHQRVQLDERDPEATRERSTDGGLARAAQPDERNDPPIRSLVLRREQQLASR